MKKKYGCTPAGYDMGRINVEKNPWWQHPLFPIVPQIEFKNADEYNAKGFTFCWLWLRIWSLQHFSFELSVEIDQTGFNIKAIFLWLRIVIRILPMPYGWLDFLNRNP